MMQSIPSAFSSDAQLGPSAGAKPRKSLLSTFVRALAGAGRPGQQHQHAQRLGPLAALAGVGPRHQDGAHGKGREEGGGPMQTATVQYDVDLGFPRGLTAKYAVDDTIGQVGVGRPATAPVASLVMPRRRRSFSEGGKTSNHPRAAPHPAGKAATPPCAW